MYTYLQQALPRVVIHRTQVVEKKWKLRVRLSVHQTKISTNTDKHGFSPAVVRSKLEQKKFRCEMFSLLRLCFVFYGEIYVKNGSLCSFLLP